MKQSDKALTANVWGGHAALYSYGGIRRAKTKVIAALIEEALPHFRKLLSFPDTVAFRVAPIKGTFMGKYYSYEKLVEISPELALNQVLRVVAHELVHAEQYHTGKLKPELDKSKGRWVDIWEGEVHTGRGTTYKAYRALPWEVEAYDREQGLAKKVAEIIQPNWDPLLTCG